MFHVRNYQIDYLEALYLLYAIFPNPIKAQYFTIENHQELYDATNQSNSLYSHPLDDTSIVKYNQINDLPIYYTQQLEQKTLRGVETGNNFNLQTSTLVIPDFFGLVPTIDDFIVFSSVNSHRLYRVTNVEVSNLFEQSQYKAYRIAITTDKYRLGDNLLSRVVNTYRFSYDFYKIFHVSEYQYLSQLFNDITKILYKLDQYRLNRNHIVNLLLTSLYNRFSLEFEILLRKNEFNYIDPSVDSKLSVFFKQPLAVDINDILNDISIDGRDFVDLTVLQECINQFYQDQNNISCNEQIYQDAFNQYNTDSFTYDSNLINTNPTYLFLFLFLLFHKINYIVSD